ncbi:rsc5 [Acrasis kona]|uniref:Rsc5 n=1 Tax=Acrasis kona TaxID=1008807 RepID=A0AAW2ZJY9_9EUKA
MTKTTEQYEDQFKAHPILSTMNKEQIGKFVEFENKLHSKIPCDVIPNEEKWLELRSDDLDDMCLYRFLYGYGWDVDLCVGVATEMLEWQRDFKPKEIKVKDIKYVAESGYLFHYGHDKKDRPILWLISAKDKLENTEPIVQDKFKHLVHSVERCIEDIKDPTTTYRITWVVELADASVSMAMAKALKSHFDVLGARYPERCAQILVLNPPWVASWIWTFVKAFLTHEMQERYVFIRGNHDQIKQQLLGYIDEDQIIPELYEGKAKYKFDLDKIIQEDEEREKTKDTKVVDK